MFSSEFYEIFKNTFSYMAILNISENSGNS